jgi:hypothetical protein
MPTRVEKKFVYKIRKFAFAGPLCYHDEAKASINLGQVMPERDNFNCGPDCPQEDHRWIDFNESFPV